MAKSQDVIEASKQFVADKEKELLKKQSEVLKFVEKPHSVKATKKYVKEVRAAEVEVNDMLLSLLILQEDHSFKARAKELCEQGRELKGYAKEINTVLATDLAEKKAEAVDPVKMVVTVAGMAVAFVNISKNTFDPDLMHGAAETSAGASVGLIFSYHKRVFGTAARVARAICTTPKAIKNSFGLYYAKETVKDAGRFVIRTLKDENSIMILGTPSRATKQVSSPTKRLEAA